MWLISIYCLNEIVIGSTGLKLEDLRPDLILLSNSNEPQHHQASGKEAQPHHSNKHQSPTHLARVEKPFVSEKMIVASSAKAYSYTRPEQQHTSSFKTSGMQQVIGIKNYGGDAEIVVENEVTQENGSFKQLPIMRKYGVDESVKLSASEIKRLSGECFQEDMLIQRKRTYTEAIADIGIQKEHKITKVIPFIILISLNMRHIKSLEIKDSISIKRFECHISGRIIVP